MRHIKHSLACPREDRERLLSGAGEMLNTFAQENPGAFYRDYIASFGPPENFAGEMLSTLDPEDVAETRRARSWLRRGIAAVVIAALFLSSVFWCTKWAKAQKVIRGDFYAVETIEPISYEDATKWIEEIREQRQSDSGG